MMFMSSEGRWLQSRKSRDLPGDAVDMECQENSSNSNQRRMTAEKPGENIHLVEQAYKIGKVS